MQNMHKIILLILLTIRCLNAQAFNGYTLFSPNNSKYTYLVNMSNQTVKTWTHSKSGGYSCYLLEDGSVIRSALSSNSSLNGGGATGVVQKVTWGGVVTWEYTYSSSTYRAHHDIEPMPNGNVLLIAWEVKTASQAVQAGSKRNASFWPDHIIEVQPNGSTGGNIVWQWHAFDHLIQDYNSSKSNYGVVKDHPELLDINMTGSGPSGDWMHINGISFNTELDQIAISSHNLNEVYVIDHSTTTAEAASHTGGNSGKGGDILYRWGNPANYDVSGTRVFDVVHCAWWIPLGSPGAGHLMAFNNRASQSTSMVVELNLPVDSLGNYTYTSGTAFAPTAPEWSYTASGFFSVHLGGVQRLANGNTLIAEATSGYLFEVNSAGATVWSYNRGGEIARALRYPVSYSGVSRLTSIVEAEIEVNSFTLMQNYPNPFNPSTKIIFNAAVSGHVSINVYNSLGEHVRELFDEDVTAGSFKELHFDGQDMPTGVYFYRLTSPGYNATKQMILIK